MEEWLSGQNTYNLHKSLPRNPYNVMDIDDVWEIDLADLSFLSKYNEKYKYILNAIGVFWRYAWSVPLRDKIVTSIKSRLKFLFRDWNQLLYNEIKLLNFLMQLSKSTLNLGELIFILLKSRKKGAIFERFNRTLKTKMYNIITKITHAVTYMS